MSGYLIVFEGIDGCGKTTQIGQLARSLLDSNIVPVISRQPGGTELGADLRKLLFHSVTTHNMAPYVADCLLLADHLQVQHSVILPALEAGRVVLSDRSPISQFAYAMVRTTHPLMDALFEQLRGPQPDQIIFLHSTDVEAMVSRARLRIEGHQAGKYWSSVEDLIKVQEAYETCLTKYSRVMYVDVTGRSIQEVSTEIWDRLDKGVLQRSYRWNAPGE